jgi:hypothetical protein
MSDDPQVETPATTEPEPEGVVEVQGQKMVPVTALTAERERARTKTEEKIRAEYEPIKQKAAERDQLAADLAALQPHIDYLNKHPEFLKAAPKDDVPDVSDDDAERYARQYELYTPNGLDTPRAKRIIADNRAEMSKVARQAAHEAVQPYAQMSSKEAAKSNYLWAAQQQTPDGQPLVDPQELARMWAEFPPELAANPDVARVILEAAVGRAVRSGKRVSRSESEPLFTEAPGGQRAGDYRITDMERKMARTTGMDEKKWTETAKTYKPDAINILGD